MTGRRFDGDTREVNGAILVPAFVPPAGCGKSTLLRSINRMNNTISEARFRGQLTIKGQPIYTPGVDVMRLRKRVGMVFQKPNPLPTSILENVAWGPACTGFIVDLN